MGHSYFCTECGMKNTADTVLFNMEPLITGEDHRRQNLKVLKLRLKEKDLLQLIAMGEMVENGFSRVTLTFPVFMTLLSGKDSMDDPRIRELSLDELIDFVHHGEQNSVKNNTYAEDDEDLLVSDDNNNSVSHIAENGEEVVWPEAIEAMLERSEENIAREEDETILKHDLEYLARRFQLSKNMAYSFEIKVSKCSDDLGGDVITGYWLNGSLYEESRICCNKKCYKPIFPRAGVAEHRVVSFVGETASGKTSTILALSHYCKFGIQESNVQGAEVWKGDVIREDDVYTDVLSDDMRLLEDLDWYTYGIAPQKTEDNRREDAYHSTIFVRRTGDHPKRMILSLMDLPGELFNDGKLNKEKMKAQFSAAFSSSAFVICFDATNVSMGKITNYIDFYEQLQDLRKEETGERPWIPCMILFTKCDEKAEKQNADLSKIDNIYFLRDEKAFLENEANPIHKTYESVKSLFKTSPHNNCYYSVLRTGAFGHEVPTTAVFGTDEGMFANTTREDEKSGKVKHYASQENKSLEEMRPSPNQIDLLMKWILCVSGCTECNAIYKTRNMEKKVREYLQDTQFRAENPSTVEHAILRSNVFINPGIWDRELIESLNNDVSKLPPFLQSKVKGATPEVLERMSRDPESNAKEKEEVKKGKKKS